MAFAAARGAVDPPSDDAELEARATEDSSMAVRCPPAGGARRITRKAEGGGGEVSARQLGCARSTGGI